MPGKPLKRDSLLHSILSLPSAPFRESQVIRVLESALDIGGVPHFRDPTGNVVVGAASRKDYLKLIRTPAPEPVRVFVAHTDHPGFHGVSWKNANELQVKWHGGSPTRHLKGGRVWLAGPDGLTSQGKMLRARLIPSARGIDTATVSLPPGARRLFSDPSSLFGGFGFRATSWMEGDLIYTKAADDLVGAFAIVDLALELFSQKTGKSPKPFLGLLTRAEEVGFIGAIGHFETGWLHTARRPVLCVSLETSRALPGAEIGKGPVVRLGDRYTVFDPGALRVFSDLATRILPGRHQRRVMDGGTCEATTATVYGFPCVGISVPLGNYHNQSFEGGPDSRGPLGPAPEFVHQGDIGGLLELCQGLMKPGLPWSTPWDFKKREFRKALKAYQPLLHKGM